MRQKTEDLYPNPFADVNSCLKCSLELSLGSVFIHSPSLYLKIKSIFVLVFRLSHDVKKSYWLLQRILKKFN